LVGFALVNTQSHHGSSIEHNMGEFFVARKYRRLGVATKAAGEILRQYPGALVAVAERNLAARMFWPRALAAAPSACQPVLREVTVRIGAGQSGASERLIEVKSTTSMLLAVRRLCRDSNAAGHTLTAVEIWKEFLRLIVEDCRTGAAAVSLKQSTLVPQ
jgi:hypothetical protein